MKYMVYILVAEMAVEVEASSYDAAVQAAMHDPLVSEYISALDDDRPFTLIAEHMPDGNE